MKKNTGLISALVYTGLSLAMSVAFVAATLGGQYKPIERIGGAVWVFMLSMIILMPLVTPWVKKHIK